MIFRFGSYALDAERRDLLRPASASRLSARCSTSCFIYWRTGTAS